MFALKTTFPMSKVLPAVLIIPVLAVGAVTFYKRQAEQRELADRAQIVAQAAANRAAQAQAVADRQWACASKPDPIIASARAAIAAGTPQRAITLADECGDSAPPELLALKVSARSLIDAQHNLELAVAERARSGIRLGMTTADVLQSAWGKPTDIKRTTSALGSVETWSYPGSSLVFRDGVLIIVNQ